MKRKRLSEEQIIGILKIQTNPTQLDSGSNGHHHSALGATMVLKTSVK